MVVAVDTPQLAFPAARGRYDSTNTDVTIVAI